MDVVAQGQVEQRAPRLTLVASSLPSDRLRHRLVAASRPHLRDLTRKVGWPVSIAVRKGSRMVLLDTTHNETSLTFERYHPGFSVPVVESASGSVCLALMPCAERDAILRWMQSAGDEAEALPPDDAALRSIQQQGYMALDSERYGRMPGRPSSIAVPILYDDRFVASLTLIYFAAALRQEHAVARYMPLLRAEAQAIAAKLAG